MLGLYLHRESVIHRLPAGAKLGGLLLVTVAVLALPSAWGALAAGLIGAAVLVAARLPAARVLAELRAPVVMLTLLFGFQALLAGGGWEETAIAVARFATLILLATLVTLTTRVMDMVDLFERLFGLLRPVGVNPAKMALMLALTIRFIPLLGEQVREVRMAQRARGVERNIAALFVPLLVKILTMADDLTAALEARGYDPAEPETKNST
ncbi:biotin transport system permease protein [Azospirillum lipoferum]|uniref:Energy-coupling factor transporter transmembrane protein EcfT n=1 Tax=Azospirillum lipoferum TaxID=193 RepID=A0A5A9GK72_AZOLI|nr:MULTISPECIES: energy-coupling factor transporter transmembrane protein EcfT [Azospirillum]KAA0594172.1 energy-coupling factor transporter transmembrane protein EcfT [Azospirillum lipoferum]MCP1615306.1 biotin transport system permease protein [Azospirillum lipoferum]MDW5531546.1 energy-coupling factor transporter transmembrane protein EcfT [Azospirillum sp. NL1]